jgi:hypothetical protein
LNDLAFGHKTSHNVQQRTEASMKRQIEFAIAAGAICLFCLAPAYAQDTTEYLGTTGQSAGQMPQVQSLGSSISNQLNGEGQAVDQGNPTPSYDSNGQDPGQTLDSGGSSDSSQGSLGDDNNN